MFKLIFDWYLPTQENNSWKNWEVK